MSRYFAGPQLAILFLLLVPQRLAEAQDIDSILKNDDLIAFQSIQVQDADSLFHESVESGAIGITKYLIQKGASINSHDEYGQTPLLIAVNSDNQDMAALLLEEGAHPDTKESGGLEGTPLMYATAHTSTNLTKLLIEQGASIDIVDMNGDPALNWASFYGFTNHMRLLIDAGADLTIRSKHGDAVDVVLRLWHEDSVAAEFRRTSLSAEMPDDVAALFQAIQNHDTDALWSLLNAGVDPNATDGLQIPMLHLAIHSGKRDLLDTLLRHGADPNLLNRVGQSALAIAARFGHQKLAHLLLAYGANPDVAGEEYMLTPLMGAAVKGDVGMGKLLLAAGASLNIVDIVNQVAALHWSLFYNNEDFASFLIEANADIEMPVLFGEHTALSLAIAYGQREVEQLLRSKIKELNPVLGSWKMSEIYWVTPDTTYSIPSAQPGRLLVSPSRYTIMYNPTDEPRTPFSNLSEPSSAEMVAAFQSIVFNSGSYELSDSTLVTTSDVARVPGFEGGKQFFKYIVTDDRLTFSMFDETYPDGSKPSWAGKMEVQFVLVRE